ncbi:ROK family protein [Aeromicrobium sp. CTD01-1L150]|uniref:ROK family protein n=1 Tax=Aeromicrobium sp. CTD01-1L150 TaxID=3341830 RepID=UPI0035BEFFD2
MSTTSLAASRVGTERLRRHNTARVLRSLREQGPASRSVLSGRTDLAKATVGAIVSDLADRDVAREGEPEGAARGRPSRPVSLVRGTLLGLGLEVNVDYVAVAVVDLAGGVVTSRTRPSDAPTALTAAQDLAREVLADLDGTVVGACLAVPGLVEVDDTVAWAPNLRWEDATPGRQLADALGLDVSVENDANLAAVAEGVHGAAQGARHALYLTGTVGIGAGILQDGRLVRGAGFAGEVGHMPLGIADARCGCGRLGCWEATIGLRPMLAAVRDPETAPGHPAAGGHENTDPLDAARRVARRADQDPRVRAALTDLGGHLGHGIASLSSILDPQTVVLGGYFAPLAPWLIPVARDVIDQRLPSADRHRPALHPGALGIEAAAVGAGEQALLGILEGTVAVP